jgi:hypothetical protein
VAHLCPYPQPHRSIYVRPATKPAHLCPIRHIVKRLDLGCLEDQCFLVRLDGYAFSSLEERLQIPPHEALDIGHRCAPKNTDVCTTAVERAAGDNRFARSGVAAIGASYW